jgi:hypothetical protein
MAARGRVSGSRVAELKNHESHPPEMDCQAPRPDFATADAFPVLFDAAVSVPSQSSSEPIAMNLPIRLPPALFFMLGVLLFNISGLAGEPTPPRSTVSRPRTGQTQSFGPGTLTHRSDGTSSQTRPFGSGSITTERTRDGRTITGDTQKFGSGTITRWSDGSTTETRPFGSGSLTTERSRDGKTVTGHTQKFGSGTITNRSDGSSTRSEKFGSGTLQRDQPGRK